jgi:hypothetical protein
MRETKPKTEHRAEYQRLWLRAKRAEQKKKREIEAQAKADPCDLNAVGEKGNTMKAVPLSQKEYLSENPDKTKTDWVNYKLTFPTAQLEEDWKKEPRRQESTPNPTPMPSFENMLNNSGSNKGGMQSICPYCARPLNRRGQCDICDSVS